MNTAKIGLLSVVLVSMSGCVVDTVITVQNRTGQHLKIRNEFQQRTSDLAINRTAKYDGLVKLQIQNALGRSFDYPKVDIHQKSLYEYLQQKRLNKHLHGQRKLELEVLPDFSIAVSREGKTPTSTNSQPKGFPIHPHK